MWMDMCFNPLDADWLLKPVWEQYSKLHICEGLEQSSFAF